MSASLVGSEMCIRDSFHTDSSAALGICNRSGIGKVRHLAMSLLWVQERLREGTLSLSKCQGGFNPADLCTKFLDRVKIDRCLQTLSVLPLGGRPASAPQMAA
eukprot:387398-Alexandrium_andersonii.AAC.1